MKTPTGGVTGRASNTDDLAPLTWLTNENVIKQMINIDGYADSVVKCLPPTDDHTQAQQPSADASKILRQHHRTRLKPYDSNKPPLSFNCLIFMAIEQSPKSMLRVKDIYHWIADNYPYFRDRADAKWKNSVRHNLSINKCFKKVNIRGEECRGGKESYWCIDSHYRPSLIEALQKSNYQPYCHLKPPNDSVKVSDCSIVERSGTDDDRVKRNNRLYRVQIPSDLEFDAVSAMLCLKTGCTSDELPVYLGVPILNVEELNEQMYTAVTRRLNSTPPSPTSSPTGSNGEQQNGANVSRGEEDR